MTDHSAHPAERRRAQRLRLQIPVFVRCIDPAGTPFLDLSRTLDISASGACLVVSRSIRANEVLSLTIPAPPPSSTGLIPAGMPPFQARVRRLQRTGDVQVLGVEFLQPID